MLLHEMRNYGANIKQHYARGRTLQWMDVPFAAQNMGECAEQFIGLRLRTQHMHTLAI